MSGDRLLRSDIRHQKSDGRSQIPEIYSLIPSHQSLVTSLYAYCLFCIYHISEAEMDMIAGMDYQYRGI